VAEVADVAADPIDARELGAANQRVNAAYAQLPACSRPVIESKAWKDRENAIDAAHLAGDPVAYSEAVKEWERFALSAIKGVDQ